jgi:hypothetical protein
MGAGAIIGLILTDFAEVLRQTWRAFQDLN